MKSSRVSIPRRSSFHTAFAAAFFATALAGRSVTYQVNLGDTFTENAVLSSNTGLVKTGLGTLHLANPANSYTGATLIAGGTLVLRDVAALGATSSLTVGDSTPQGGGPGTLLLGGGYASRSFDFSPFGGVTLTGNARMSGLALVSVGNNTISGGIVASSTATTRMAAIFGITTISGYTLGTNRASHFLGNGNWSLSGLSGSGTLQKTGNNTLVLTGANQNTGIVNINGGTVRVSSAVNLGLSTAASAILINGGTLEVRTDAPDFSGRKVNISGSNLTNTIALDHAIGSTGLNRTVNFSDLLLGPNRNLAISSRNGYSASFTGAGGIIGGGGAGQNTFSSNGSGTLTLDASVWNNASTPAQILTFNGAGNVRVTGSILAPGAALHRVVKSGTGTLTIEGAASTYRGATDIQQGTVAIREFGALGDPALNSEPIRMGNFTSGGTLEILGVAGTGAGISTSRGFFLAGTTGGGRINASQAGSSPSPVLLTGNISASGGSPRALTLGGTSPLDNEIAGSIASFDIPLSVIKADSGTWVLSGANNYYGNTTITAGTLKLRATGPASDVLFDASAITFGADAATQNAGGVLEFVGLPGVLTFEDLGGLVSTAGANTVRLTPGAGGQAALTFGALAGSSSVSASVNFVVPTALDTIRLIGQPTGFVRASTYFNGSDFAHQDASGVLRAPSYSSDAGFATSATALTSGAHQQITGSFTSGAAALNSLKIAGSQTLTLTGLLQIGTTGASAGGILVSGGNATITGGSIGRSAGATGALVVRVDGAADSLVLAAPLAASLTGGLGKNGLGTLALSGANAQTGATDINEGTVRLAGSGRLSAANQPLNLRQGATLDLNGVSSGTAVGAFNGSGTVTNNGGSPATFTVGNNNGGGLFSGIIQDGTSRVSVVQAGSNTLTWNGRSTYTGSTTLNGGGLVSIANVADIGQPSGLGRGDATNDATNAASLVFGSGSPSPVTAPGIRYTGVDTVSTDRLFTLAGTSTGSGARIQASSANNATLDFRNPGAIAYAGGANSVNQTLTLGGFGTGDNRINLRLIDPSAASLGVAKADGGTWVLGNAANTYSGPTTISAGRLLAKDGASLPAESPLVFSGTGVFESSGMFTRSLNPAALPGTGGVVWTGGGGFAASDGKLTVNLGGGVPLTWGAGGFVTVVSTVGASLRLNSSTALFETEFRNAIDLGGSVATVTVDDNLTTNLDLATLSGVLSGTGTFQKSGGGTLQLLGANTYSGETFLNSGTLTVTSIGGTGVASSSLGGADAAPLRMNSGTLNYVGSGETADRPIQISNSATISSNGSGGVVLRGVTLTDLFPSTIARTLTLGGWNTGRNEITSPLGTGGSVLSLFKGEDSTWILSGASTYTGGTNLNFGTLGIGHSSALGTGLVTFSAVGSIFSDGSDRTLGNAITFAAGSQSSIIGQHSLTFSGDVTFGSGTSINASTIYNDLAPGARFEITRVLRNTSTAAVPTIIFDGVGRTVLAAGAADSTSARATHLTNRGGTLVLAGASTYSGATTVTGGTVVVSGTLGQTSSVLVNGPNAVLTVNGAINPAAIVTVSNGTVSGTGSTGPLVTSTAATAVIIAPGNSIGILTVQGNAATPGLDLSRGDGAVLSIELGKVIPGSTVLGPGVDYDQIVIAGDTAALNTIVLGFNAALELTIPSGLSIDIGDVFFIAVNTANSTPVSGTFEALPEGATLFASDGTPFAITYQAAWTGSQAGSTKTGGNDIAVVAVPEPGTTLSLLLGLAGLAGLGRRFRVPPTRSVRCR